MPRDIHTFHSKRPPDPALTRYGRSRAVPLWQQSISACSVTPVGRATNTHTMQHIDRPFNNMSDQHNHAGPFKAGNAQLTRAHVSLKSQLHARRWPIKMAHRPPRPSLLPPSTSEPGSSGLTRRSLSSSSTICPAVLKSVGRIVSSDLLLQQPHKAAHN